jgi:hypothetical protein
MVKRTANVSVKMLPAIQNAFDLWTIMRVFMGQLIINTELSVAGAICAALKL